MSNRRFSNLRVAANNTLGASFITPVDTLQSTAPVLSYGYNIILNASNPFDSIKLPPAVSGSVVIGMIIPFINNFIGIYAFDNGIDVINLSSNNTDQFQFPSFPSSNSQSIICICSQDGVWSCNFAPVGF